ncbi:MAG: hypothetical protein IPK82_44220 [Polyangiaceae bacterium]|nr:hypothetical protein [Polyangiaceae bacterium]
MDEITQLPSSEKLQPILAELGRLCGATIELRPDSLIEESGTCAATAVARAPQGPSTVGRHDMLVKLFIAEDEGGPCEWALLFHYIDDRLVSPPGYHYVELMRKKSNGEVVWKNMGWKTDEYGEWSELGNLELGSDW